MAISLGSAVLFLKTDATQLNREIGNARKQMSRDFGELMRLGQQAGRAFTVMGGAIVAGLGFAVKAAADFSTGLAEVRTLGVQDMASLESAVRDVSKEFGLNLIDATKAAYQALSAGATEMQTPRLLAESAKAATAGMSDLTTSIELVTGVNNAFGLSLDQASQTFDKTFLAVKFGVTTFGELGASLGKVSPIAAAAGLSTDELFASVAALTKGGIATSEAVTGMKGALVAIVKPTSQAAELAEELGIKFDSTSLRSQGLAGFLNMVAEATHGNIDQMATLFGGVEGLNAVLALTGNQAGSFTQILNDMKTSTGATQQAFDAFAKDNPAFTFAQLQAEVKDLQIEIGQKLLPVLKDMLEAVKPMITSFADWAKEHERLFGWLVKVTAGVGALFFTIGPLLMALPGAISLFKGLTFIVGATGLTGSLTGLVGILAGPVGVGAAIVATTGLVIKATSEFFKWRDAVHGAKEMNEQANHTTNIMIETLRKQGVNVENLNVDITDLEALYAVLRERIAAAEEAQGREISSLNGVREATNAAGNAAWQAAQVNAHLGDSANYAAAGYNNLAQAMRNAMNAGGGAGNFASPPTSRSFAGLGSPSMQRGGNAGGNTSIVNHITIQNPIVRSDADIKSLVDQVDKTLTGRLQDRMVNRGLRPIWAST